MMGNALLRRLRTICLGHPRSLRCYWIGFVAFCMVMTPGNFCFGKPPAAVPDLPPAAPSRPPRDSTAVKTQKITSLDQRRDWNFRNHVQSVLTKFGCNSGACHGAAAGKNGFKLSLRGYDPEADFLWITRQSRGRRIVPTDPSQSLLLTKPTGVTPHKGGVRFAPDSLEARVLAEWIAAGHAGPSKSDPRIVGLEISPPRARLRKGQQQQLVVVARFDNGSREDVTRWAKFTSTNQTVVKVDDNGLSEVVGHGEGAVGAWYLANNVTAIITSPYDNQIPKETFVKAERANFIDDLVLAKLESLNIPASPVAGDAEFVRRVYLDTIGRLPTIEETKSFVAEQGINKRGKLVDSLLARPEFVDYWTYKWSDLLLVNGKRLRPKAVDSYSGWIRKQVEANTPWDEFVRQILTARGNTFDNGAANFYALHQDPLEMAENASMAFLGMSIGCARCHDHPLEKWTNNDYYSMANLFARVRGKGWGGDVRSGDGLRTIFLSTDGELIQPRTGKPLPPQPLDGVPLSFDSPRDRRIALAEWMTSPQNPYFSRAIVNRVWANFFGVGIVERVDDLRLTNPASNEELFTALADHLVSNGYDLRKLIRTILTSRTYQRSSKTVPGNGADERFYSHYYPKRLSAEVLLDAIAQVSHVPTKFAGYPDGTRALQLRDSDVASYFLETFGRPDRLITCECERSSEPSMTQVLHILNGDTVNAKLESKNNVIDKLLAQNLSDGEIVERLYLSAFSRLPTLGEKSKIAGVLSGTDAKSRRLALEDLFWSVLSSKEFLFNH